MKIVVWTLASLLVTFIASSDGGRIVTLPESSAGEHFPSVKATSLEKRDFNLPADFEGDRNLLLVAFEREQQFIADVAHEMKTPIATLRGSFEVTLTKERNIEEYKKKLPEIEAKQKK